MKKRKIRRTSDEDKKTPLNQKVPIAPLKQRAVYPG